MVLGWKYFHFRDAVCFKIIFILVACIICFYWSIFVKSEMSKMWKKGVAQSHCILGY